MPVKKGDPIGLFVVTERGREAVRNQGMTTRIDRKGPPPSAALARRPETGPWTHAALPKPKKTGTIFRPSITPATDEAKSVAPSADDFSPIFAVPLAKDAPSSPPARVRRTARRAVKPGRKKVR
jgi:hypothetical protein